MGERTSSTSHNLTTFSSAVGAEMPNTFSWKGKTFHQIISAIQMNTSSLDISANNYVNMGNNVFLPQPLKIYRKEIVSVPLLNPTVQRTPVSIDEMNRPGGSIVIQQYKQPHATGLDHLVIDAKEMGETNNSTDHPGTCLSFTTGGVCLDPETNARRRVRSSGRMKPNYNSTSQQYLTTRNRTFQQNQFQYLHSGNSTAVPGTAGSGHNVYASQGSASSWAIYDSSGTLSSCSHTKPAFTPVYYKPNNPTFAQQGAVDAGSYLVRKKFDTITNNVAVYRRAYGNSVANAMGYGIADSVYTYKDKIGYPLKKTPVIKLYPNGKVTSNCCVNTTIDPRMPA